MSDNIETPAVTLDYDPNATVVIQTPRERLEITAAKASNILYERDAYFTQIRNHNAKVGSLREYLCENYEDLGEHAEAIASMFGMELTKTVTWTVTARITITGEVRPNIDPDNVSISEYISVSDAYHYDDEGVDNITVEDYEVTDISWED